MEKLQTDLTLSQRWKQVHNRYGQIKLRKNKAGSMKILHLSSSNHIF